MLYFFTWNSEFLIWEHVKSWKDNFIWKFWDFNLVHIKNSEELDNNFLVENITSGSFMNQKKLVIIDYNDWLSTEQEEFYQKILKNIPKDNIILFNAFNPDKRNKFYKFLIKNSTVKELSTKNDTDLSSIINNRYSWKISSSWVSAIIRYKSWNLKKIISEIDKLLINYEYIDTKEVIENIVPELEESIFQIIDDILNSNISSSINKIEIILNEINIYAFYNNLIANLRTSIYILKLKSLKLSNQEISANLNLWSRAFLINKRYKVSFNILQELFINLVKIDKKMKSWMLNWTEDKDFRFELERILLK